MNVLIVEKSHELSTLWQRHLERLGHVVRCAQAQDQAIAQIQKREPDIIILNLVLERGSALAVSDFASYRVPNARVIFVTDTTFFADGSIFAYAVNACAYVQARTPPDDIAAMVDHFAVAG